MYAINLVYACWVYASNLVYACIGNKLAQGYYTNSTLNVNVNVGDKIVATLLQAFVIITQIWLCIMLVAL